MRYLVFVFLLACTQPMATEPVDGGTSEPFCSDPTPGTLGDWDTWEVRCMGIPNDVGGFVLAHPVCAGTLTCASGLPDCVDSLGYSRDLVCVAN